MRPPQVLQRDAISQEGGGFSFFKILLEDGATLNALTLPRRFRKKFGDELPSECKIAFYTGASFKVKCDAERKMLTEIQEVCKYGGLSFGDVLIFTYHRCGNFELSVYSPTGLEKEFPLPENCVDDDPAEECVVFRIEVAKSYMLDFNPGVYIKKKYAAAVKRFPNDGYITCLKDDKMWKLKIARKGRSVLIVDKAWVSFLRDLNVVCGQVIEFKENVEKKSYDVRCLPTERS